MPRLGHTRAVNPGQLYDELVAALPELVPPPTGPGGLPEARVAVEVIRRKVFVTVPDGTDPDAVAAVVAAHKRTPVVTTDVVGEARAAARALVERRAADGDDLAQAVLVLLA